VGRTGALPGSRTRMDDAFRRTNWELVLPSLLRRCRIGVGAIVSLIDQRTDAENWAALKTDPLAYIRELAYAHAERAQVTHTESRASGTGSPRRCGIGSRIGSDGTPDTTVAPGPTTVTVLAVYRDRRNA